MAAVANEQPVSAVYKGLHRLFGSHLLGRNQTGEHRVPCLAVHHAGKLRDVKLVVDAEAQPERHPQEY